MNIGDEDVPEWRDVLKSVSLEWLLFGERVHGEGQLERLAFLKCVGTEFSRLEEPVEESWDEAPASTWSRRRVSCSES